MGCDQSAPVMFRVKPNWSYVKTSSGDLVAMAMPLLKGSSVMFSSEKGVTKMSRWRASGGVRRPWVLSGEGSD
jgi:hypothetical protein